MLDGTGQLDNGVSAAIVLAAAGAQIDVIGNARSFGHATTQFVYYDDAFAAEAQKLRDALGVGEIVRSDQTNSATDMTVVLGEDYLAVAGSRPVVGRITQHPRRSMMPSRPMSTPSTGCSSRRVQRRRQDRRAHRRARGR